MRFLGMLHIGTRMTVVRLRDGSLLLHSPVPLSTEAKAELDALGPVQHVVCPNLYHHVHASAVLAAYPQALLHAPAGLQKKRPDLPIGAPFAAAPHPAWAADLRPFQIEGSLLGETVFLHERTRTLISSDLTENFETSPHLLTRLYLKANGIHGKIGWSRMLRVLYRDRAAARRSIDQLLGLDFNRLIIGHGNIIQTEGREAVRGTFTWL